VKRPDVGYDWIIPEISVGTKRRNLYYLRKSSPGEVCLRCQSPVVILCLQHGYLTPHKQPIQNALNNFILEVQSVCRNATSEI